MPSELIVFFTAMIPFVEMKLAIPIGAQLGLSNVSTLLFAIPGTIIPGAIILALVGPIANLAGKHSQTINKWLKKLLKKTQKEHSKNFKRYGAVFLILFVAVPIPGSSAGAAALIAFLFGVDYWKALSLIAVGTLASGLIVTAGVESIFAITKLFN